MTTVIRNASLVGMMSAAGASMMFSVNDVSIKFLSGDYALHQVVLVRSLVAMAVLLGILVPLQGGFAMLRTRRPVMHMFRGAAVLFANLCFFMALATMPIADAVAIFFVSPLLVTVFSVVFLREYVGPRRWAAVAIGLLGVLIVLRPGTGAFQPASLLVLAAATGYATLHTLTRRIGGTESAVAMAFYIQVMFLLVCSVMGLVAGDGRFAGHDNASLDFLLRGWVWPAPDDWLIFFIVGATSALGGFLVSQAYKLCESGLAAPFEYIAMPMAIFWGVTVFGEWPDFWAWVGILLIVSGGLYMVWRETLAARPVPAPGRRG